MCFVFISCSTDSAALEYRMDPNWLSAVSLLGACGGDGVGVRCYGVPSECHAVGVHHAAATAATAAGWLAAVNWQSGHVYKVSAALVFPQLSYRRQRQKEVNTLTTANSTAELTLPGEEDDYIIRVRTLSEGGLGPASEPIRIHQMSKRASATAIGGFLVAGVKMEEERKFRG